MSRVFVFGFVKLQKLGNQQWMRAIRIIFEELETD